MAQEKTPKELIEELYNLFSTFKGRMEDPNFIQIENALNKLVENQQDMKREIKEMKRQLLSPFDGVIVETKKNTEARLLAEIEEAENQQNKKLGCHCLYTCIFTTSQIDLKIENI